MAASIGRTPDFDRATDDRLRRKGSDRQTDREAYRLAGIIEMSSGGWSCPHEVSGKCSKVGNLPCDPGMKGCELYGRYAFFNDDKNERLRQKQERSLTPLSKIQI